MGAARPRWAAVLKACRGVTVAGDDAEAAAPAQHADLLLDACLVRAFCVESAKDKKPLESFLAAVSAHSANMLTAAGENQERRERAEAYEKVCKAIADLYREDGKPEIAITRQKKAKLELNTLKPQWNSFGGSEEQRCIFLEAVEGPVVCGEPERNYDNLFMS